MATRGPKLECGVYEIVNTATGKRYVGSTVNFRSRWATHKSYLRKGTHHSRKLQHSFSKHGEAAFLFNKLLVCAPEKLLMFEQICLDGLKPEYNIAPVAGNQLGMKQSKEWIANAHKHRVGVKTGPQSAEWIEKRIAPIRGRKQSAEHVEKRVASLRGKQRKPLSLEHRAKISAACKAHHASH